MGCHSVAVEVGGNRVWIVFNDVDEEESTHLQELIQSLRAGLEKLEHGEEPRVPFSQIGFVPHACRLEQRFQSPRQLVRCKTEYVLLIEPVELIGIEDRIACADTAQVER